MVTDLVLQIEILASIWGWNDVLHGRHHGRKSSFPKSQQMLVDSTHNLLLMLDLMRLADIIGKILKIALSIQPGQDSSPEDLDDLQNGGFLELIWPISFSVQHLHCRITYSVPNRWLSNHAWNSEEWKGAHLHPESLNNYITLEL